MGLACAIAGQGRRLVDLVITGGWSGGTVVLVKLTCDLNRYNGCVRTTNASGYRAFTLLLLFLINNFEEH